MLPGNLETVQRVGGNPEKIPFDEMNLTDWLWLRAVKEAACIKPRNDMLRHVFEIRLEDTETFPSEADRLALNYCAGIVASSCSWCPDTASIVLEVYGCTQPCGPTIGLCVYDPWPDVQPECRVSGHHRGTGTDRVAPHPQAIWTEFPNSQCMVSVEGAAKSISDAFVRRIGKSYDLQCRRQNTIAADNSPRPTVDALHPYELALQVADITQQVEGLDSRLSAMEIMMTKLCDHVPILSPDCPPEEK